MLQFIHGLFDYIDMDHWYRSVAARVQHVCCVFYFFIFVVVFFYPCTTKSFEKSENLLLCKLMNLHANIAFLWWLFFRKIIRIHANVNFSCIFTKKNNMINIKLFVFYFFIFLCFCCFFLSLHHEKFRKIRKSVTL